jgi:two-component system, chemotaxis family, response regulator Rcp1
MKNASDRPNVILLVEDNVGEARLTEYALRKGGISGDLYHVSDGVEAIRFLRCEAEYAGAPLPELVPLDLDLPREDGREVLTEVKGDLALRLVPVVISSTSGAERDVAETCGLHANAYVVKPVDLDRFVRVARHKGVLVLGCEVAGPGPGSSRGSAADPLHRGGRIRTLCTTGSYRPHWPGRED